MARSDDALAAVRRAVGAGAWSEALEAIQALPDDDPDTERLELLAAAAYGAGDLERAIGAWEEIHALRRQQGAVVEAAHAAAMVAMYLMMDTGLMSPVRGWLVRVDRLLEGHDETPVHALVAMLRAYERLMSGELDDAGAWAHRAITIGDRYGVVPATTLGRVAAARVQLFQADVTGGMDLLEEVAVTLMSGDVDALTTGMVYCELICAMQGLGEYDRADEWTRAMDGLRTQGEFFGGINGRCRVHRAEILRLRGRCAEAEDEALHACEELRPWMRREFGWPLTELGTIRLRRGDLAGAEEAFRAAHANGWEPQPGLAQLRLAQGEVALAHSLIEEALKRPFPLPWKERPPVGGLSRAPLLDAYVPIAIAAGDVEGAADAAAELADLASRYGSRALQATADLARSQVDLVRGRAEEAVTRSRAAVDAWCIVGGPYEAASARLVLAQALDATGRHQLAGHEQDMAAETFAQMGAVPLPLPGAVPVATTTPEADTTAVFRCDGDTRTVQYAGETVLLRDLKGMRYLERLLTEPGREFHALDLVAVDAGTLPTTGPAADHGELTIASDDVGPALDDQARRAYRRRLEEIEQDIEDAGTMGDTERAAQAKADRDFIVAELSRAFGIGGRKRPVASTSERARTSVTRAIRYTLKRIGEQHGPLAEHLQQAVNTGTYCSYTPDPRVPIKWET